MIKLFALLLVSSALLFGQQIVVDSGGNDTTGFQIVLGYSGNNLAYTCKSPSFESTGRRVGVQLPISGVTKAAAAVVTSTAHGFDASSRPKITISGATGTGWTGINTVSAATNWTATILTANTFSIPVNSTGFGTLAGTVIFTTTAPRTSVAEWSVMKMTYDASNNLIWRGWLNGTSGYNSKCSDAAGSTVQQQ